MNEQKKIEQNAYGHFKYLPQALGYNVKQNQTLTTINCGLGSSMFNIVFDTHLASSTNLDQTIKNVIKEFADQPFAWWIGPTSTSKAISQKLLDHGFIVETTEHAMICDLEVCKTPHTNTSQLDIKLITNAQQLEHFIQVIEPYDQSAHSFYTKLDPSMLQNQEKLFVGYAQGNPAVIGILYTNGDTAGIFSLLTKEDKRGHGYGTQMMNHLLDYAKKSGVQYVTLSASSDSGYRIYERLGFKSVGQFECFEWKGKNSHPQLMK